MGSTATSHGHGDDILFNGMSWNRFSCPRQSQWLPCLTTSPTQWMRHCSYPLMGREVKGHGKALCRLEVFFVKSVALFGR